MQTIQQLPNGEFQVEASNGQTLGPFRLLETAEAAERMLNMFDAVDISMAQLSNTLKEHSSYV